MTRSLRTSAMATLALVAFAGNSVLCRLALLDPTVDPTSFTAIRLISGAVTLLPLAFFRVSASNIKDTGNWYAAAMLFVYAILFSWAYVEMETGTGALVLFGSVQISMILVSLVSGNRLSLIQWAGLVLAVGGFIYLFLPELKQPSLGSFVMMILAGMAWAAYTLYGQISRNALRTTAFNFLRSLPMVAVLGLVLWQDLAINSRGFYLAVASGALTSGLGYAIWYAVLPKLKTVNAAVIQLLVPLIAAVGGIIFADEAISTRLLVSIALVLGGISLVTLKKQN